jgi:hypothetical protein
MVPHSNTQYGTGGNTGGVKGMVVGSLKSRRTRERVLALTAALSFVGLLLGAPPFRFGETEMPGRNETSAGETFHRGAQQGPAPPLDDVWQGLTVGVCLCNRPIVSVGSCRHIPLIGYQPCPAGAQPTGGALSHRTLRLATGASLARSDTSLAGVTFTPAQPPFTVNSLLGEKTNLKQKKPSDSDRLALGLLSSFELALAGNYNHKIKMGYGRIALGNRMFDVTCLCTSIQCVPMAVLC